MRNNKAADALAEINYALKADSSRNAFPKTARIGDQVSGTIVDVERRHRAEADTGRKMFWANGRPQANQVTNRPVMDSVITVQTDLCVDGDDEGLRKLWIDQGMKVALHEALERADAELELGGRVEGLMFVGSDARGRRAYNCDRYISADAVAEAGATADFEAIAGMPPERAAQLSNLYANHPQASAQA